MSDAFASPATDWTDLVAAQRLPEQDATRRACLERLVERYQQPIRAMMRAWGLRDENDLDDAVQEFFLVFIA